ncbi:hypothetical protein WDU94_002014 [Cyamophila willieti]
MEDHKRKNKKRNHNKKPTPEQIKKLQNNIDQNEVKLNGVAENGVNKANHSNNSIKHAPESQENKVIVENQVNGENKRSKKKNKTKGKPNVNPNDNQTPTVNLNGIEKELEETKLNSSLEKVEEKAQLVSAEETISENVNLDTPVGTYTHEQNQCSPNHSPDSSPCAQYHSDEAPNCSDHIQHELNKVKVGDFKIDFDVQKLMTPMGTQSGASNKEYFYKGLNIDKLEAINNEAPETVSNEKIKHDMMPNAKQTNEIPLDETVPQLRTPVNIDSLVKNMTGNSASKSSAFVNPDEMLKSLFGNVGNQNAGFINPDEMMKNMLGNLGSQNSKLPNPDEMLKNMFGSNPNQNAAVNPKDLLNRVFGSPDKQQTSSINPEELMKNVFGTLGDQSSGPLNSNEMLKNIIGSTGQQSSNPVDLPLDGLENPENHNVAPINPDDMMKNMLGNLGNPMDMLGQMNAMAQQMDPNMMNNMNQMMSNMDPAVLSGMTNMVAGLMQGGGLGANIQSLMQMKAQKLQNLKKIEINEDQSPPKNENINKEVDVSTKCFEINQTLETPPEDSKEFNKGSKDVDEKKDVEIPCNKIEKESENPEEPVLKCSFSFSSNVSEKSGDEMIEETETKDNLKEDSQIGPSKPKIFVREESMPELLENLIKVNKEEVKTKKVEIKTSKFKTILSKVLRKEKKTVAGETSISTTEIQTQHVEYKKNKTLKKNEARKGELDYEKLHHVKEPMEVRERKEIKIIPRRAKDIKDPARDEKETFKQTG